MQNITIRPDAEENPLLASEVQSLLATIIARNPDARNPASGGMCLYTDKSDRGRHCIVGQLAAEAGWAMPEDVDASADIVASNLGWPITKGAAAYLRSVQRDADVDGVSPKPWGEVFLGGRDMERLDSKTERV